MATLHLAWRSLLPLLLLVLVADEVRADYLVTFPCVVFPGVPVKLGISILRSSNTQPAVLEAGFLPRRLLAGLPGMKVDRAMFARDARGKRSIVAKSGEHVNLDLQLPAELANESSVALVVNSVGSVQFTSSKVVRLGKARSVFVQTDKAVYKPEQEIRLRVLAVQADLLPYRGALDVFVQNSERTVVAQWLRIPLQNGIWEQSLPLSSQPPLGKWKILVKGRSAVQLGSALIEVKEYASLPKFQVVASLPNYIALDSTSAIRVGVQAMYTYGQPVRGTVNLQLGISMQAEGMRLGGCYGNRPQYGLRAPQYSIPVAYRQFQANLLQLDSSGRAVLELRRQQFLNALCPNDRLAPNYKYVVVNASVMDDVTGEVRWDVAKTKLHSSHLKLAFDRTVAKGNFKPGLLYSVRILVSTQDGQPVLEKTPVAFTVEMSTAHNASRQGMSLQTSNGVIEKQIAVPTDTVNMAIRARLPNAVSQNGYDNISPRRLYSPSDTFIQLSSEKMEYAAGDRATFTVQATASVDVCMCSVYGRGRLIKYFDVKPAAASPDTVSFAVATDSGMSPRMQVVCAVSQQGELVVDSMDVAISNPFSNSLSIAFDVDQAEPGHNASVTVRAVAGSTVAVSVVDQSALLLGEGNDITVSRIEEELASYGSRNGAGLPDLLGRKSVMRYPPFDTSPFGAAQVLDSVGVCTMTNLKVPRYVPKYVRFRSPPLVRVNLVRKFQAPAFAANAFAANAPRERVPVAAVANSQAGGGARLDGSAGEEMAGVLAPAPAHTRTIFPETWIWATLQAGEDGTATIRQEVPDSITSWVASGFATSPVHGLGVVAQAASLRAFRPFFISVNLPYSVIRGEELHLQVNLFTYIATSSALIELQPSEDFTVQGTKPGQVAMRNLTVPLNTAGKVTYAIVPRRAGHITLDLTARSPHAADRVKRQLLVEAEGLPQSYSRALLIALPNNQPASFDSTLKLELPPKVVPGSVRTEVSIIGDLMGPALSNLDQLLKMPTGCGEQNMLGFAPDVFIMKYLTNTQQLTPAVAEKAKRFMTVGYQRQLTYRRQDNSFSAFGNRDQSGSLWLTAFVVKSFAQARPFIFIDTDDLSKSVRYILSEQKADGSFPLVGTVVHQSMKGGLQGNVARTAYVLTTLTEAKNVSWQKVRAQEVEDAASRSRVYLERSLSTGIEDNYTLALTAYALALADSQQAGLALDKLLERAERSGEEMFWTDSRAEAKPQSGFHHYRRASSSSIELTAYGLLALTKAGKVLDSFKVARWLSLQRNSRGGFGSTQDTVVGLQAMAELAALASNAKQDLVITMETKSGYEHSLQVTQANSIVLQKVHNVEAPSELHIHAQGTGQAVLTVEVFYNLEEEATSIYTMDTECSLKPFRIGLSAQCQYCTQLAAGTAADAPEGMALLEVGLPSGFEVNMEHLLSAFPPDNTGALVKKVENPDRRVVFYLDEVPRDKLCVNVTLNQIEHVTNLQPSVLRTVNYYQPSMSASLMYSVATEESCMEAYVTDCPVLSSTENQGRGATGKPRSASSPILASATLIVLGMAIALVGQA